MGRGRFFASKEYNREVDRAVAASPIASTLEKLEYAAAGAAPGLFLGSPELAKKGAIEGWKLAGHMQKKILED